MQQTQTLAVVLCVLLALTLGPDVVAGGKDKGSTIIINSGGKKCCPCHHTKEVIVEPMHYKSHWGSSGGDWSGGFFDRR